MVAVRLLQTSIEGALLTGDPCADSFGYLCGKSNADPSNDEAEAELLPNGLSVETIAYDIIMNSHSLGFCFKTSNTLST